MLAFYGCVDTRHTQRIFYSDADKLVHCSGCRIRAFFGLRPILCRWRVNGLDTRSFVPDRIFQITHFEDDVIQEETLGFLGTRVRKDPPIVRI